MTQNVCSAPPCSAPPCPACLPALLCSALPCLPACLCPHLRPLHDNGDFQRRRSAPFGNEGAPAGYSCVRAPEAGYSRRPSSCARGRLLFLALACACALAFSFRCTCQRPGTLADPRACALCLALACAFALCLAIACIFDSCAVCALIGVDPAHHPQIMQFLGRRNVAKLSKQIAKAEKPNDTHVMPVQHPEVLRR